MSQRLSIKNEALVVLVVNNLGSISQLEMAGIVKEGEIIRKNIHPSLT